VLLLQKGNGLLRSGKVQPFSELLHVRIQAHHFTLFGMFQQNIGIWQQNYTVSSSVEQSLL
jgi:hypothetical protein